MKIAQRLQSAFRDLTERVRALAPWAPPTQPAPPHLPEFGQVHDELAELDAQRAALMHSRGLTSAETVARQLDRARSDRSAVLSALPKGARERLVRVVTAVAWRAPDASVAAVYGRMGGVEETERRAIRGLAHTRRSRVPVIEPTGWPDVDNESAAVRLRRLFRQALERIHARDAERASQRISTVDGEHSSLFAPLQRVVMRIAAPRAPALARARVTA